MSFTPTRTTTIILLLLFFVTLHLYVRASLAEPDSSIPGGTLGVVTQQPMGILTTHGNNEISVNGLNSIGGATILSGSSIETPAGVSATIRIGNRGSLEIEPSTKLTLEIDQSGVKAMLTEGCVHLQTMGTVGEIFTPKGSAGKTDSSKDDRVETCPNRRAAQIVAEEVRGDLFRLGTAAAAAIIARGATAVAVPVAPRGVLY